MSKQRIPVPTNIEYNKTSRLFKVAFESGEEFELSAEFLRVYSPSAEVRGHSPDQEVLQVGKADVTVEHIEPVGTYAVLLRFDDGHDTGIYSWEWLYYLGSKQATLWQEYLDKLDAAGAKRQPDS